MKLNEIGYLGELRQRLGAEDENDTRFDNDILKLSPFERVRHIAGWNLGDSYWAITFKHWCESQGIYLTTDADNEGIIK
jgi:hypothetical protein